ncbi:MAG: TetR/AcrR family transcriptional regulator [Magnetococcales bacterium]|nr:TetR/AcrR family transcriptional regulator [Magnetococcales bacterium]
MARRREHDRDALFERALITTRHQIMENGLEGLNARKLAKAIHCSVGTLYTVIGNLDALILHLNARTLDDLYSTLSGSLQGLDHQEKLLNLIQSYLQFVKENEKLWNTLFEHRLPEGEPLPEWYQQRIERLIGLLEEILAQETGDQDPKRIREWASALWCGIHGITALAGSGKLGILTNAEMDTLAERLVTPFMKGLSAMEMEEKE